MLRVVTASGSADVGGVVRVVEIEFEEGMTDLYRRLLLSIKSLAFDWIGERAGNVPASFSGAVTDTYVGDFDSFLSYYKLSMALCELFHRREGPLTPTRMIRPNALVTLNAVKGGTEEYSRALLDLMTDVVRIHPLVFVLLRMVMTQTLNVALAYRMCKLLQRDQAPSRLQELPANLRGYSVPRKSPTKLFSISQFGRQLVDERIGELSRARSVSTSEAISNPSSSSSDLDASTSFKPRYS